MCRSRRYVAPEGGRKLLCCSRHVVLFPLFMAIGRCFLAQCCEVSASLLWTSSRHQFATILVLCASASLLEIGSGSFSESVYFVSIGTVEVGSVLLLQIRVARLQPAALDLLALLLSCNGFRLQFVLLVFLSLLTAAALPLLSCGRGIVLFGADEASP